MLSTLIYQCFLFKVKYAVSKYGHADNMALYTPIFKVRMLSQIMQVEEGRAESGGYV